MDATSPTLDPRPFLSLPVSSFLRRTQGRETFLAVDEIGSVGSVVVKRTRGGAGLLARLGIARGTSPAEREHRSLIALAQIGVRVPRAIAWCAGRDARGRACSVVVMDRVEHSVTLREQARLGSSATRRALLDELNRLVTAMHADGWYHRDLYLHHFVVREPDGALVLLDVGRACHARAPRERWFVKDLAALLHSTPDNVTRRERARFLVAWLRARGLDARADRRRWARAIERKRARMAAHVPRDERPEAGR